MTRGVWLLNNILGTPPAPPPDNVAVIDPDVRGATSMREVLAKHRSSAACNDCHQKIDPLGFGLENVDPIGAWRTSYTVGKERGPLVDASGELPGGKSFKDVGGLKQVLVARQEQFVRMLTEKLLAHACGHRIQVADKAQVDQIQNDLASRAGRHA